MTRLLSVTCTGLLVAMMGCTLLGPKEARYLRSAQDRAMQDEIKQEMGPPLFASMQAGETVWVYQRREEQSGSRITASGLWCDEYVLTFDDKDVLRHWTHKSKFHGGENMPTYCVSGGYQTASQP